MIVHDVFPLIYPYLTFILDLNPDFVKETKHWILLRPFTGQFSKLPYEDKKDMKEIFEKYDYTGDDVGNLLSHLVEGRRKMEMSFLKSEDDTDFRAFKGTRSDGRVYARKYNPSFSEGLQNWNDLGRKTHDETMKQLFDDAQALIKKWNEKGEGEPNLRDMALGHRNHVTYRAISEANINRIAEGRGIVNEAFTNGIDNDMEDVFGGRLLVRLYDAISGGMMGVRSHFNVSKPGQSPFHGFTILSGAGVLADNLMENYSVDVNSNWGLLLKLLRVYGVREDICNTGKSNDSYLGHINNRKFIFYHEHFRADGFEELKNVRYIKNQVYHE